MSTKVNSTEQKAIETLLQFFYDKNILPFSDRLLYEGKFSLQGLSSGNNNSSALTPKQALIERYKNLLECIQHYFHLLQDNTLKLLINEALNYRNQQITQTTATPSDQTLLGDWALIIDTMKVALEQRRDLAAQHFQELIQYGMEGKSSTVDFYLKQLHSSGFIDHLFIGILTETLNALQKQKNEDNYYMLTYFQKVINDLNTEATVKEEVEKQQYTLQQTKITSSKPSSSSTSSSSLVTGKTVASSSSSSVSDERSKEVVYMEYSQLLNQYIKESQGNIPILQEKLKQWFQQPPTISTSSSSKAFSLSDFEFILEENIKACEKANYQNKLKLLQFIKTFTNEYHTTKANETNDIQTILTQNNADITLSKLSTYHAPQFIDRQGQEGGTLKNIITYETLFSANTLLFYEGQSNPSSTIIIPTNNKKKKLFRKQMKLKIKSFILLINEFLYKYGWVVIDDLLSLELIKRIRIESNLLRHFYEQSEIWVGKKADIGAHLTVPSIRGDRVLWVCGGHNVLNNEEEGHDNDNDEEEGDEGDKNHNDFMKKGKKSNHYAPEGVSRVIKTIGEIEPCKLEVKASAPIRKFSALKESITIFDKFIEELKQCQDKDYDNTTIHSIYERSDAMLSIYPGEGARFANHIDNTTQDGRVLTLVNYMNPGWTEEMGGAIRLRPKRHGYQPPPSTTSTADEKEGGRTYPNFSEYDGIDVYPMAGRAVLFFSSQIEHEVMPTYGDRHALTIWYYDKHERKQAIERAKEEGSASKVAAASVETQQAAKEFIAELMGGDEVPEDGGNPTIEELQLLTKKVSALSDEILEIIASITGAPSVQSFRQGFPMLTVQDLKAMRALFRRMGLQQT